MPKSLEDAYSPHGGWTNALTEAVWRHTAHNRGTWAAWKSLAKSCASLGLGVTTLRDQIRARYFSLNDATKFPEVAELTRLALVEVNWDEIADEVWQRREE